jgi:hypothetical protein
MLQFIDQPIEVRFDMSPLYAKSPPCPQGFFWQEKWYVITREVSAWSDFERRGRMGKNMQPTHATRAARAGSWGVGRFYYRVETDEGRVFDIYFDRAPHDVDDRKGNWFLLGERACTG